jgi:hypothetical protein
LVKEYGEWDGGKWREGNGEKDFGGSMEREEKLREINKYRVDFRI